MNGYGTDESITELLEGLEFDELDELAERRRRGRGRGVQTAPGRGSFQPRPATQDVTQTQLMATIARIEAQIKTNSEAITKVNASVNKVADQQASQAIAIKKQGAKHEKDIKDLRQTTQLLALLPLITRPATRTINADTSGLLQNDKVLIDSDGFTSLLPLLLVGGLGGGGGGLGGGGGGGLGGEGDSSSLLILALALGGGLGGRR